MISERVQLIPGDQAVDDRGSLRFVNEFNFQGVKRFYLVENHQQGFVRAWHGHKKEGKYVTVVSGAAIVATVKIDNWDAPSKSCEMTRHVLSAGKPSVLWIPPGFANGFRSLTADTRIMFFSTSTVEESRGDDIRWAADYFGTKVWHVEER